MREERMKRFTAVLLFLAVAGCSTSEQAADKACRDKGYDPGSNMYNACVQDTLAMYKKGGLGGK
jgi:hypothetical protein